MRPSEPGGPRRPPRLALQQQAGGHRDDGRRQAQLLVRRRSGVSLENLSPREREVLALMAEGRSNSAIAQRLVITHGAVEKHVSGIFNKLGLPPSDADHGRVLAVLAWLRGGRPPTPKGGPKPSCEPW